MADPTAPRTPSRLGRAIRMGIDADIQFGAVAPPIYTSSTFSFADVGEARQYDYGRCANPNRDQLGAAISVLEDGAAPATIVASGMAAITALVVGLLQAGDTIVVPHDCYGGSWRLFDQLERKGFCSVVALDLTAAESVQRIEELAPAMVWVETPSNPLMRITDLAAVSAAGHAAGAIVVADNTFCTPLLQRPIEHGADFVVHSTTKYLNGHSDVVGGAIVAATIEGAEQAAYWANCLGLTSSPWDAAQVLRGMRTLAVRMRAHQENAAAVAEQLAAHPVVTAVHYPGLADHPGHELAARQQDGFGAMLSFELAGGEQAVRRFADGLTSITLAESLGGVESLIAHPASMTHAAMTPEAQAAAGITEGLVRMSVGIEPAEDLAADLAAGLARAEG
ncbi:cystathionine gamma-synthase [Parenemella sanctibonifatiensis]|uniref:L-methionine gamma-lyase n=1 Tax=Parenemella sanctibonifatiensis TaxID=2016505 RepID=A0A255EC21_9ACTN|nr:cystathionine gamma-synthase [Parenemella sanctibonifatiensis]OYN88810.1 O-succinylhomoserine (thiol)-lyase [Parenemella sanctibonifatiensis]